MASLSGAAGKGKTDSSLATIANTSGRLKAAGASLSPLSASYADTGNQSYKDQLLTKLSPLLNVADSGLNVIERPAQGILHGLAALYDAHGDVTKIPQEFGKGFVKGFTDIKGTDNLNARGAAHLDPNRGGRATGLADTVISGLIDPASYVTGGTGSLAKTGLKIVDEQLGKDAAQQIAKRGLKSLPAEQQTKVLRALRESTQAAATKKGAEDFTQRVADALAGGKGVKVAGKTVLKYDTLAPAAEAAHIPQTLDALKGTKAADIARQAFKPLAKVEDAVGKKAAGAVATVLRKGRAAADNATTDVLTQTRSAIKDSGVKLDDLKNGATTPEAQQLLDRVQALHQASQAGLESRGLTQPSLFDTPVSTRVLDPKALKAINNDQTRIARALQLDAHATPAEITKHLLAALPNAPLGEANERLAPLLGVKNVYKMNPIEAATDITVKSHRDAAVADTLHGLADIKNEFDEPILLHGVEGAGGDAVRAQAKKLGYQEANTVLGKVYAPKEILKELDHASVTLTDDHALKELGGILDKWGKLWRGYATVPTLFGVGFHERNLVGNIFNMWLGGFRDVSLFKTADKIGRAIESGTGNAHLLNKGGQGLTADQAIDAAKSLSPEERQWIRQAREYGAVGDSFFRTDQATQVKAGQNAAKKVATALNPLDTNNAVLRSGTYVGRRIEDNSRLAMFISEMRKHGDPEIAAEQVKKYLFDYSELTPTEKAIKKIVPFYTYTRKNTPLQLQAMLQNPGKFSQMAHFRDNMQAGAPDTSGKAIPQYALQSGAIPLLGGNSPVLGSMSTPYQAAGQQIQPLLELLSQTPGTPKDLKTEGGSGKAFRELLGNFGGGPLDAAKFGVEQATGTSLLTGNKLKAGTTDQRLAKTLMPLYGKGNSTIGDLSSGDASTRNARLLSGLLGLSTTTLNDAAVGGEQARRARVLSDQAAGTPTVSELRKTGKMPKKAKATGIKKVATPKKKSPLIKKTPKK